MNAKAIAAALLLSSQALFVEDASAAPTLVRVVNAKVNPVNTRDANTATQSFTRQICVSDNASRCDPAPDRIDVPLVTAAGESVKQLVIDYVSARCSGDFNLQDLMLMVRSGDQSTAQDGDNFSDNELILTAGRLAQSVRINAPAGATVSTNLVSPPRVAVFCRVQLHGHLELQ